MEYWFLVEYRFLVENWFLVAAIGCEGEEGGGCGVGEAGGHLARGPNLE